MMAKGNEKDGRGAAEHHAGGHRGTHKGAPWVGDAFDPFADYIPQRVAAIDVAGADPKRVAALAAPILAPFNVDRSERASAPNVDTNVDKGGFDPFAGLFGEEVSDFAVRPSMAEAIREAMTLLRDHDATRTHEPVSERTERHYRRLVKGLISRSKGGYEVTPPERVSRSQSTFYNRRAALIWAAAEGVREALILIADVSLRRGGGVGLPKALRQEVGEVSKAGAPRLKADGETWKRAPEMLRFWGGLLVRYRPGSKEGLAENDGCVNQWREAAGRGEIDPDVLDADPGDRDSRRKQADLARKIPNWKARLWASVDASSSKYRLPLALSFALGPRPAEIAKGARVSASRDGRMRVEIEAVKNDNGHGCLRRVYLYDGRKARMSPWERRLWEAAVEAGGTVTVGIGSEKAYSESVKEMLEATGVWRPYLWRNSARTLDARERDLLSVGLCLTDGGRNGQLAAGVVARSDGETLEVRSLSGRCLASAERAEGGYVVKRARTAAENVAAKDAPWIGRLLKAARTWRREAPGSRWGVLPVALGTEKEACTLFDKAAHDGEGRQVTGWRITPYMLRHQYVADCKMLAEAGGVVDRDAVTEMTGNKSSWKGYGGRATGSPANAPSFVEARRVLKDMPAPTNELA